MALSAISSSTPIKDFYPEEMEAGSYCFKIRRESAQKVRSARLRYHDKFFAYLHSKLIEGSSVGKLYPQCRQQGYGCEYTSRAGVGDVFLPVRSERLRQFLWDNPKIDKLKCMELCQIFVYCDFQNSRQRIWFFPRMHDKQRDGSRAIGKFHIL